jgi:pimeloyl-ACP methyl ester carboxylesterase
MFEMRCETVAGVRCAVYDSGPCEARTAVVFVHGNPGPADDWEPLAPAVVRFTRALAMDLPGFGRAARPRDFDYSVRGYARLLGALIDAHGIERVHLVLHDFGGAFGLRWALDHPQRLGSLALLDCGVLENYRWHRYARIWQTPVLGELFQLLANERALRRALEGDNPRPLPREFTARIARYADWGHKRAVLKLYRNTRDPLAAFPDLDRIRHWRELPVCVIWGAADPYLSAAYAQRQKDYFPRAEVHVLEGLGHWPFVDDPAAVENLLVRFLRRAVCAPG